MVSHIVQLSAIWCLPLIRTTRQCLYDSLSNHRDTSTSTSGSINRNSISSTSNSSSLIDSSTKSDVSKFGVREFTLHRGERNQQIEEASEIEGNIELQQVCGSSISSRNAKRNHSNKHDSSSSSTHAKRTKELHLPYTPVSWLLESSSCSRL